MNTCKKVTTRKGVCGQFLLAASVTLAIVLYPSPAFTAGGVPFTIQSDVGKLGKSGSSADKGWTFDFGLGASNPSLFTDSTNNLKFNKNSFKLGDGLSSTKTIEANIGGSPNPKMTFNTSLGAWQFSNDGTNFSSFGSGSGSGASGVSVLQNGDFESGIALGWSVTGGTYTAQTGGSNLLFGTTSALWQPTSSGQQLNSTLYLVPAGMQGTNCQGTLYYKGGDSSYTFQALDGSSNVLGSVVLSASATTQPARVTFVCPGSGSMQLQLTTNTNSPAIIAVDNGFLGQNVSTPISQAQLVGTITLGGANLNNSSVSGISTWGLINNVSAGSITYSATGALSNPTANRAGFTYANMPPGDYLLVVSGALGKSSAGGYCGYRFSDGTNNSAAAFMTGGGTNSSSTGFSTHLTYTTAATRELDIQVVQDATSQCFVPFSVTIGDATILVYRVPTSVDTVIRPDATPASWSGSTNALSSGWTTTSNTIADFTNGVGVSLVQNTNRNFGTVTAAAGPLPGITYTPPRTGNYWICSSGKYAGSASGSNYAVRLIDSNSVVLGENQYVPSANNAINSYSLCGISNAANLSPITVKLQGLAQTGTISLNAGSGSVVQGWSVVELDAAMPTPVLVNSITSNTSGSERIERITFGGASSGGLPTSVCSAGTCSISSQSGSWVTSVTWNSTGNYTLTIPVGEFSGMPSCTCSAGWVGITGGGICHTTITSPTNVSVLTYVGATSGNQVAQVICQGPR